LRPIFHEFFMRVSMRGFIFKFALSMAWSAGLLMGGPAAAESVRSECSQKYQAAKAAGTLNGQAWPQFYSQCSAEAKGAPEVPPATTPSPAHPLNSAGAPSPGLYICAEHADEDDFEAEFSKGPVVVPAGTVFDYAGHMMGGRIEDPKDAANYGEHGWKGISPEEDKRRSSLIAEDMKIDEKNTSAVATTSQVSLTKSAPCALADAEVMLSNEWGWTISPLHGDAALYYQAYGVIRRGALDTTFDDDSVPLNFLAARGELNGSIRGTITKTLNLDQWSASQPPDDAPVEGKGNSECWGDESRQDISCRALTDRFLLSMRGATRREVVEAMKVVGREVEGAGLHFVSNYSRGQLWGSGGVNFVFNQAGRVSIIFASIDAPASSNGKHAEFIWNAERDPAGCSDLPGTKMKHCN
jgi:hypothetical protein